MKNTEVNTELVNAVFNSIYYDLSNEIDKQAHKLCISLKRNNNREYNDFENSRILIVDELFNRLSRAKVDTLQNYINDSDAQRKLIAQVRKQVKDNENNDGKIYEVKREKIETDSGVEIKQVREYANQVSFDKEYNNDSDVSFSLVDSISVDDIRVPNMRQIQKGNVVQVLRNVQLFSKPSQPFIMLLFTEGESEAKKLLGMTNSNFNQKIERLECWIKKHEAFQDILTGEEQEYLSSLTDMQHFENLLNMAERTQVQKWLKANQDKQWVKHILDEKVDNDYLAIESWDIEGERKNSYQFINALTELQKLYKKEVTR